MFLVVLVTAPPNNSSFGCVGMIDYRTKPGTAVSAFDLGGKDMGIAVPAGHSTPAQHLCLHQVKNLRLDDCFVAFRHIILWHLAVIDEHLLCQKVRSIFLLKERIPFILFVCENIPHSRSNPFSLPYGVLMPFSVSSLAIPL